MAVIRQNRDSISVLIQRVLRLGMSLEISYQNWCDFLVKAGAVCTPAEMQGFLCGVLCNGKTVSTEAWVEAATGFMDIESSAAEDVVGALEALLDMTRSALQDDSYGLKLMLPNDETTLCKRTEALAVWVQGFLHGVATAGATLEAILDDDGDDILRDLTQIAQLEEGSEDSEANESFLFELVEFVRMAVFTIHSQLHAQSAPSQGAVPRPSTH